MKVNDKVCYRRAFLQSIGEITGDMPRARGVIVATQKLGKKTLCEIDWESGDWPRRVIADNLARVTQKRGVIDPE